jgi:hypothetical protein
MKRLYKGTKPIIEALISEREEKGNFLCQRSYINAYISLKYRSWQGRKDKISFY